MAEFIPLPFKRPDALSSSIDALDDIGEVPVHQTIEATLIAEEQGELVYGRELGLTAGWCCRQFGAVPVARYELKVPGSKLGAGFDGVLALHPYTLGQVHVARFKPARSRRTIADEDVSRAEADGLREVQGYLERLSCDYWETSSVKTAAFVGGPQRESWSKQRQNVREAKYLVGIVEGAPQVIDKLRRHERIEELSRLARERRLAIGYVSSARPYPEVAEEAGSLMELALRQALGGLRLSEVPTGGEKAPSVVDKVERVFRELVNARNRWWNRRHSRVGGEHE